MLIDSHIHIGDRNLCKEIIEKSKYKNIYRLYSCINPDVIYETKNFLKEVSKYFAIPLFFAETNIEDANELLLSKIKNDDRAIPILLISYNEHFQELLSLLEYKILKEHFSLHHPDDVNNRSKAYNYLSQNNGYLLLHTLSDGMYEYVLRIRKEYPGMNIILAHLGRNSLANYEYTTKIIDSFYLDEKIFADVSTIKNPDLIKYAVSKFGKHRVLYGSDFPFEINKNENEYDCMLPSLAAKLTDDEYKCLFYNNAQKIIEESKIS